MEEFFKASIKQGVIDMASRQEFDPYSMQSIRNYRTGFFLWGYSTIEIYGLYYDETLLLEGGKISIERLMRYANAAYNLGILKGLRMANDILEV